MILLVHSLHSRPQYSQTPFRHLKVWRDENKRFIQAFGQHIDIFRKRTGNIHSVWAIGGKCIICKNLCHNAPTNIWSSISIHQREAIGQRDIGLHYCKGVTRHSLDLQDSLDCCLAQNGIRGARIEKRHLCGRSILLQLPHGPLSNLGIIRLCKLGQDASKPVRVSVEPDFVCQDSP